MLEIFMHAGVEHPGLAWILIPAIMTFIAGLGIGHYLTLRAIRSTTNRNPVYE